VVANRLSNIIMEKKNWPALADQLCEQLNELHLELVQVFEMEMSKYPLNMDEEKPTTAASFAPRIRHLWEEVEKKLCGECKNSDYTFRSECSGYFRIANLLTRATMDVVAFAAQTNQSEELRIPHRIEYLKQHMHPCENPEKTCKPDV
jgi:hypothetical protein